MHSEENSDKEFETIVREADLFIPIGPACRPVEHLKRNGLRKFATPLDWMIVKDLSIILHLYRNQFADFFIENEEDHTISAQLNRVVKDMKNNVVSPHHFSLDMSMEEEAGEVRSAINRRFHKTDHFIKCSEKIILLGNRMETIQELEQFLKQFADIYAEKIITLVNVRHNSKAVNMGPFLTKVGDKLEIIEFVINDVNFEKGMEWLGNELKWQQVLILFKLKDNAFKIKIEDAYKASNKIIIFGAGANGALMIKLLKKWHVEVWAAAVSDMKDNVSKLDGVPVKSIYDLQEYKTQSTVIISVKSIQSRSEIRSLLEELQFTHVIDYNETPFEQ